MVDEKPGKAVRLLVQDETAQSKAFFTADVSCVTTWISRFFAGSAGGTQEGVLSAWNRRTANGLCTANAAGGKRNIDVLGIKIGVEVIWRWTAHFCIVSKKN